MVAYSDLVLPVAAAFNFLNPSLDHTPARVPARMFRPFLPTAKSRLHSIFRFDHEELFQRLEPDVGIGLQFQRPGSITDRVRFAYEALEDNDHNDLLALAHHIQEYQLMCKIWKGVQTQMSDTDIWRLRKIAPVCSGAYQRPLFYSYFRVTYLPLNDFWLYHKDLQDRFCHLFQRRPGQITFGRLQADPRDRDLEHTSKSFAEFQFELREADIHDRVIQQVGRELLGPATISLDLVSHDWFFMAKNTF